MDPTTTLFTFLLHTHPSVKSIELFGSWDNFSQCHKMERDSRRDRGQWRGCHSFRRIFCDGDQAGAQERSGGLRMGERYYYYYEVDGAIETHDPTKPSTNACPYLPGQTVNTLDVPVEQPWRLTSASMNSLCDADYKTMNPGDKFTTPKAAPPALESFQRVGTSPSAIASPPRRATRSLSPVRRWNFSARSFIKRKLSSRGRSRGKTSSSTEMEESGSDSNAKVEEMRRPASSTAEWSRSTTPSEALCSREMSPTCPRSRVADDMPVTPNEAEHPKVRIPEEIIEENEDIFEESEDDDDFATSSTTGGATPYTSLSPPPLQHHALSTSITGCLNESSVTIVPQHPSRANPPSAIKVDIPRSHFSFSTASSSIASPGSPRSMNSSFDESYNYDDEDDLFSGSDDSFTSPLSRGAKQINTPSPFAGYSLPNPEQQKHSGTTKNATETLGSPALIARNGNEMPIGNTSLLSLPGFESGLGDFTSELGWITDVVQPQDV